MSPDIFAHFDFCPICRNGLDTGLECDSCGADWMPFQNVVVESAALKAERDAVVAQRQWQPIRTAPKDGRAILVWNDTSKNCEVVFWNGHWAYQGEDHFGVCCSKWMSLDAAIDAAKEKARCTAKK